MRKTSSRQLSRNRSSIDDTSAPNEEHYQQKDVSVLHQNEEPVSANLVKEADDYRNVELHHSYHVYDPHQKLTSTTAAGASVESFQIQGRKGKVLSIDENEYHSYFYPDMPDVKSDCGNN